MHYRGNKVQILCYFTEVYCSACCTLLEYFSFFYSLHLSQISVLCTPSVGNGNSLITIVKYAVVLLNTKLDHILEGDYFPVPLQQMFCFIKGTKLFLLFTQVHPRHPELGKKRVLKMDRCILKYI